MDLKWKRPNSSKYPKIWHKFNVKNSETNDFEEYRIQDLPESMTEAAIDFLIQYLCKDEPLCQAYDIYNDEVAIENLKTEWKSSNAQRATLVCFKEGSNDIVGISMNYVVCKEDVFKEIDLVDNIFHLITKCFKKLWSLVQPQYRNVEATTDKEMRDNFNRMKQVYLETFNNFNVCEHYVVDKYLTCCGIAVARRYRGRGIGEQLLKTRKIFCNEFDIKFTIDIFTSDSSNAMADKAGFQLDKSIEYDAIREKFPHLGLPQVQSNKLCLKSLSF